jgi:predicted RNA-binding protein
MCLARVMTEKKGEEDSLAEEVALIRLEGASILLRTFLGKDRVLKAKIKEIDFLNSTVLIEED